MTAGNLPTYYGLNGRPLGILISTILTFGFVLVGYDQGLSIKINANLN